MPNQVIEFAPFHLTTGMTEADLRAGSTRLHDKVLKSLPGFVRRQLVRHGDGAYADIVCWESKAQSDQAMSSIGATEAGKAYFALMDFEKEHAPRKAGTMEFFEVLGTYERGV
ncbi:hypothetical protein [Sulfitobacter sp. S45]|uniref:hypothetical protein n=1 Tax=Sulfitobacter sp. S45 TaxID=3368581 RepID=UPI003744F205